MTLLVLLSALTVLAMFVQDILATGLVVVESRNLGHWAGLFDALGDFASKYGTAIVAAAVVKWGLASWETLVIISVTALTSYLTVSRATSWAHRMLPRGP